MTRRTILVSVVGVAMALSHGVSAARGATPTVAASNRAKVTTRTWLDTVNRYRAAANVPAVREDPELSRRAKLHSRYVVVNNQLVHAEAPANPAYTAAGDDAGRRGAVQAGPDAVTGASDIDEWMRAPFHALGLIDPTLQAVGFGTFDDPSATGFRHASTLYLRRPPHRNDAARPAIWPGDGTTVTLQTLGEKETPSPYPACTGYEPPTGLPIVANLGRDMTVNQASITSDGAAVESCVIDAARYVSPDPAEQAEGRAALAHHQVIVVPRSPLLVNRTYTVTIETTVGAVSSTFHVAPRVPTRLKAYNWTITNDHLIVLWQPPDDGGLPLTKYLVVIEPGGLRFELPGTSRGANFDRRLSAGPTKATVWAVNPAGAGDALTFGFVVPETVAVGAPTTVAPPQPTTTRFLYGPADPSETTSTTIDPNVVPVMVGSAPTTVAPAPQAKSRTSLARPAARPPSEKSAR